MSKLSAAETRARADLAQMKFFKCHPELSPCEANSLALERYCDEKLMDAGDVYCYEIALLAIRHQLAEAPREPEPTPEPPKDTAHRVWKTEEVLKAFDGHGRHGVPEPPRKVLPDSMEIYNDELKRVDEIDLTPQNIKRLDRRHFNKLVNTFGMDALNDRLSGKS